MPDNNGAQAAPPQTVAPKNSPVIRDKAPIVAARDWTLGKGNEVGEAGEKLRTAIKNLLRFEKKEPEETGLLKTPFYNIGHMADGTVLNATRRATEVVEPQVESLTAGIRLTIGNLLSPLKTLAHPIERILKPAARVITGQIQSAVNAVLATPRSLDDFFDRGIENTIQQTNFKIGKIPLLGSLIAKPTNFIAGIASKISGKVREMMDWIASPVEKLHAATTPA